MANSLKRRGFILQLHTFANVAGKNVKCKGTDARDFPDIPFTLLHRAAEGLCAWKIQVVGSRHGPAPPTRGDDPVHTSTLLSE